MNTFVSSNFKMESFSLFKSEIVKSQIETEDEPMDTSEEPAVVYCEEGEISSTDEEKSITVQMPSNVTSIFTRPYRKDQTAGFVTGINIFDSEETQKRLDRAKRFSLSVQTIVPEEVHREKLLDLYKDLGIDKENERHYRFNAIHMRGTANMSTYDVLQYFMSYAPFHVEWINDVSCNVVWMDDVSAARALLNLSKRIKNLDKVHLNADPFEKEFKDNSPNEEVTDNEAVDARQIKAAIPPGYWRLGVPCEKSSILLLRYATRSDKKQKNAEKNSEYYKKYGNPHYGNIPGLISKSLRTGMKKSKFKISDSNGAPERVTEKRNPWEELAFQWGKTEKLERTVPKNVSSSVENKTSVPDLRICLTIKKENAKRIRMKLENSPNSSEKEMWESKSKIPRMKMYADDEEKKIEKNLEKKIRSNHFRKRPEEDLRTKINRKKTRPRFKFRSEKKVQIEYSESSSNESEYDDGDSGDWALEHYHDLRESLQQNRRQEQTRYSAVHFESESEGGENLDDEVFKGDLNRRSPLQIEIENDEYYLNKGS